MKPQLRKSAWLDDWFVIEPYSGSGQPEGTRAEWESILESMRKCETNSNFSRCAVYFDPLGDAWFWSPRNSMDMNAGCVMREDLDDWIYAAQSILAAAKEMEKE